MACDTCDVCCIGYDMCDMCDACCVAFVSLSMWRAVVGLPKNFLGKDIHSRCFFLYLICNIIFITPKKVITPCLCDSFMITFDEIKGSKTIKSNFSEKKSNYDLFCTLSGPKCHLSYKPVNKMMLFL